MQRDPYEWALEKEPTLNQDRRPSGRARLDRHKRFSPVAWQCTVCNGEGECRCNQLSELATLIRTQLAQHGVVINDNVAQDVAAQILMAVGL